MITLLFFGLAFGPAAAALALPVVWLVRRLFSKAPVLGSRLLTSLLLLGSLGLFAAYLCWAITCMLMGIGLGEDAKKRRATSHEPLFGALLLRPESPTFAARFG